MNDCLWYYIGICDCEGDCADFCCQEYLSVNSDEGNKIAAQYQKDIDWVIEPVREKYREKYLK